MNTNRRNQPLSSEDAARYLAIRQQVKEELPDLIARHHAREATLGELEKLFPQLAAAREAQGLTLFDIAQRTGVHQPALSQLESEEHVNPTLDTLVRYAEAVGKRLVVSLADA